MLARENAIIRCTPAADYTGYEGYAVTIASGVATLVTALDAAPSGVILEGGTVAQGVSIALVGGGLAGTVKVKMAAAPGTVVQGTFLEITAAATFKADAGTAGTVCALALESGSAGELIEAVLLSAQGTVTLEQSWNTTVSGSASGADLTVTGQVQDAAGNDLAGRFLIKVWFGEAANDGTPHDFGDLAADTGSVIVKEHTADAYAEVLTAADGSWGVVLTVAADDTVHSNALVVGKVAVDSTAVDVP